MAANEAAACRRRGYRKGLDESQRCCSALPLGRVAPPLVANCTLCDGGIVCLAKVKNKTVKSIHNY